MNKRNTTSAGVGVGVNVQAQSDLKPTVLYWRFAVSTPFAEVDNTSEGCAREDRTTPKPLLPSSFVSRFRLLPTPPVLGSHSS